MGVAFTMVDALNTPEEPHPRVAPRGGDPPERGHIHAPGIKIVTTPTDYYPISKAQLVRFTASTGRRGPRFRAG
jgi:hypothetical protein